MRIAHLDAFTADQGVDRWGPLRALGELTVHPRTAPAELRERAQGCEVLLTNKVAIDGAAIDDLPQLKYVGVTATGVNVVDLSACRTRGIAVTNVPGYSTEAVAQLVFAYLLHLSHDVAGHDARVKAGDWARCPDFSFFTRPPWELAGRCLVVVGMGAIGGAVARIARGFAMRVIAAAVPGSKAGDRMPLDEALAQADVVTLHCPLTPQTKQLVDRRFLAALKPGAILINTGRGALIDETALANSLGDGRLRAAALDVLASEPPPADHPLIAATAPWASRLVVTPHIGWGSDEARARLVREVVDNLAAWCGGRRRNRVD
ncbi:MAG TPA: D-2-hydroxyacid dehydrogenase [Planctomycetota bacterium]|nr:D-2-hydroxyacid dehydrogenase [Planctomycetota bacterium]